MTETPLWWRVRWLDAIWTSDLLPLEKLVAAVYADHARDSHSSWVTLDRLQQRASLSRDAANRALRGLVSKGWLMAVNPKPRQPVTYFLSFPDDCTSTPDGPVDSVTSTADGLIASTADGLAGVFTSTPGDPASTSDDTTSTPGVLNQSTYPSTHPSSSSARAIVASALAGPGEDEEDDRLVEQHLDGFLAANNVKAALPWLRACADSGDLRRNFLAYVEQTQASERRDQLVAAESAAKANEADNLWRQVQEAAGDEDPWQLCNREAAAMGRYGAGIRDPQVLNSVLQTLAVEREQREAS